jgi:hypothetical protein
MVNIKSVELFCFDPRWGVGYALKGKWVLKRTLTSKGWKRSHKITDKEGPEAVFRRRVAASGLPITSKSPRFPSMETIRKCKQTGIAKTTTGQYILSHHRTGKDGSPSWLVIAKMF